MLSFSTTISTTTIHLILITLLSCCTWSSSMLYPHKRNHAILHSTFLFPPLGSLLYHFLITSTITVHLNPLHLHHLNHSLCHYHNLLHFLHSHKAPDHIISQYLPSNILRVEVWWPKSEGRSPMAKVRWLRVNVWGLKSKGWSPMAEGRGPKSKGQSPLRDCVLWTPLNLICIFATCH